MITDNEQNNNFVDSRKRVMDLLKKFCSDNMGQKVTEWNTVTLLNSVDNELKNFRICPNTAPPKKAFSPIGERH